MSEGGFVRSFYEADSGLIHPIRVQPETLTLSLGGATNTPPAGPATSRISAKVSGGRRQLGLTARKVTVQFVAGDVPDGYLLGGTISLPWLDPTTFQSLAAGQTGLYQASAVEVVGTSDEVVK